MIATGQTLILLFHPHQGIITEMAILEAETEVIIGLALGTMLGADVRTHIMVIYHKEAKLMMARILLEAPLQAGVGATTINLSGAEVKCMLITQAPDHRVTGARGPIILPTTVGRRQPCPASNFLLINPAKLTKYLKLHMSMKAGRTGLLTMNNT